MTPYLESFPTPTQPGTHLEPPQKEHFRARREKAIWESVPNLGWEIGLFLGSLAPLPKGLLRCLGRMASLLANPVPCFILILPAPECSPPSRVGAQNLGIWTPAPLHAGLGLLEGELQACWGEGWDGRNLGALKTPQAPPTLHLCPHPGLPALCSGLLCLCILRGAVVRPALRKLFRHHV